MPNAANGEKPTYLGLLNAISLGEANAGVYLTAWAKATPDKDLAATLRLVAARETSHGELFARRLCELGYEVRHKPDPAAEKRAARLGDPAVSDAAKVGQPRGEEGDAFAEIKARMARDEFDPMTASLLTWYIGEEVDSARRLEDAYGRIRAKANGRASPTDVPSADAQAIMACMTAGFARLEKSIEKLAKAVK
ncbi:MAG TPA: hypothetical protein VII73_09990 [Caulobacteraceae bacterium]